MADDAHEERFRQHEAIMEGLARLLAAQHETNQRQDAINERLTTAIERLDVTQARIETLLARMLPPSENGREA
jgi:ABC-type transporter Mla subunit MlaD